MIWMTDKKGYPVFANRAWLNFVGLNYLKTHKDWCRTVHPEDISTVFTAYHDHKVARRCAIVTEYRLLHHSGQWRWVLDHGVPMFDDEGNFTGYIGSLIDITERKQVETELRIAATAFEAHEAMIITDANSIILRVNKAFTDVTGYSAEEAIGKKMNLLHSGHHDLAFYEKMWQRIIETGSWQGEIWDRRKNGEVYPKWLTITAVTNELGNVTHYVGTQSDISELKAAEKKIQILACYDPLTQLPNRQLLQDHIIRSINVAKAEAKQLAVLVLGLDRFRSINSSFGYVTGDELLKKVAARLSKQLKNSNSLARLSGDKFAILLDSISQPEDAARFAGMIIADIALPFVLNEQHELCLSMSIGISLYPQQSDNANTLVEQAEMALYQAKRKGGSHFAYASEKMTRTARERLALETQLRTAIEQQQLRLFFQAQIDIKTGNILGAEALVRWQDPIQGLIPPEKFLSVAEESGLINALGEWVLTETCRQGCAWLNAGLPPLVLAVNVAPQQFKSSDMPALVQKILNDTGFPAELLELEITENGLMEAGTVDDEDYSIRVLQQLRALGISLAIDDFGTGYSSLAYLKRFPVQVLKIDKSFIRDIPYQRNDMEIAATIIAIAHTLGFQVLAEGVETQAQLQFLQERGCDSYQGYLKSRPLPADEFLQLLQSLIPK